MLTGRYNASRPTRARGLKRQLEVTEANMAASRPTRARGLKLAHAQPSVKLDGVAPYAGAWIETGKIDANAKLNYRRALRGRVD